MRSTASGRTCGWRSSSTGAGRTGRSMPSTMTVNETASSPPRATPPPASPGITSTTRPTKWPPTSPRSSRRTLRTMDRELFDHFLRDDSRRGPTPDDAFTGAAGGAACGDVSRLSLTIARGRIATVTFDTEGCGATRAATAALAETIEGATVLEAALTSIDDTEALLGGLAPSKRHAAQLATDALHRALSALAASNLPLDPSVCVSGRIPTPNADGTLGVGRDTPPAIANGG